jgi:hypothetical protein
MSHPDAASGGLDWSFVASRFGWVVDRVLIPIWVAINALAIAIHYAVAPQRLWPDAHIYFRATETWLAGGNPWETAWDGIRFAAPPPALLLNLPLIPFGETAATMFWVVANTVAVVFLIRHFRLPWWWILFLPIFEGYTGGSPDLTLAALVLIGAGGIAGLTKPYSIPAQLGEDRWRSVAIAAVAVVVSFPFLPWSQFFAARPVIEETFRDWGNPVSALGQPLLMAIVIVALVSLGRRRGLGLTTPALLAQQPHYAVFSLAYIPVSRILIVGLTTSVPSIYAVTVIVYALWESRTMLDRRFAMSGRPVKKVTSAD